jgi:hypothetical protein
MEKRKPILIVKGRDAAGPEFFYGFGIDENKKECAIKYNIVSYFTINGIDCVVAINKRSCYLALECSTALRICLSNSDEEIYDAVLELLSRQKRTFREVVNLYAVKSQDYLRGLYKRNPDSNTNVFFN